MKQRVSIGVHTLPKEYKCFTFLIHGFCLHMIIYALRNYQTQMYQKNPKPTIFLFSGRCVFGFFKLVFPGDKLNYLYNLDTYYRPLKMRTLLNSLLGSKIQISIKFLEEREK